MNDYYKYEKRIVTSNEKIVDINVNIILNDAIIYHHHRSYPPRCRRLDPPPTLITLTT